MTYLIGDHKFLRDYIHYYKLIFFLDGHFNDFVELVPKVSLFSFLTNYDITKIDRQLKGSEGI